VRIILYFLLITVIPTSCYTQTERSVHYKIIDNAISLHIQEKVVEVKKENPLRLNPVFAKLSPTTTQSNALMLENLSYYDRYKEVEYNDYILPKFDVKEDSLYYSRQLSLAGSFIDFTKLETLNVVPYKKELLVAKNIEAFNKAYGRDSSEVNKERLIRYKKNLLHKENGHFEVSYPIISKNKSEAVLLISSREIGYELWFFEKSKTDWIRKCTINVGTID
jgi:hypothetical protein